MKPTKPAPKKAVKKKAKKITHERLTPKDNPAWFLSGSRSKVKSFLAPISKSDKAKVKAIASRVDTLKQLLDGFRISHVYPTPSGKVYLLQNVTTKQYHWRSVGNNGEPLASCEPEHNRKDAMNNLWLHQDMFKCMILGLKNPRKK